MAGLRLFQAADDSWWVDVPDEAALRRLNDMTRHHRLGEELDFKLPHRFKATPGMLDILAMELADDVDDDREENVGDPEPNWPPARD